MNKEEYVEITSILRDIIDELEMLSFKVNQKLQYIYQHPVVE